MVFKILMTLSSEDSDILKLFLMSGPPVGALTLPLVFPSFLHATRESLKILLKALFERL